VRRRIVSFRPDDVGDWVAELSCLHRQHVRHRPPFDDRAWVLDDALRSARVGTDLDCPLCDRAELPPDLVIVRTAGPFDAESLPAGLRRTHTVAEGRWAILRVVRGKAGIEIELDPPLHRDVTPHDDQPIPPEVPHRVSVGPGAIIEVDFLLRDATA
jgi:hypothetical protein